MIDPSGPTEVGKAVGYVAAGGLGLKVLQWLVRALDIKRRGQLDETKVILQAQAAMREELRKDNEELRQRVGILEERLELIEGELRGERRRAEELEKENVNLKEDAVVLNRKVTALERALAAYGNMGDEP